MRNESNLDPHCTIEEIIENSDDLILLTGNFNNFFGKLFYANKLKQIEKDMKKNIGEMMCGDQWAFIDLLPDGMDFEITESAKTSSDDQYMNSCEELSIKLNESTMGKFMWKIIAPFLKGYILYTPNDEFTKSIIEKVTKKI